MRIQQTVWVLAGGLALAACGGGGDAPEGMAGADSMAATVPMATPAVAESASTTVMGPASTAAPAGDGMAELDATIAAAEGGLTTLAPSAAVSNIEGWQTRLRAANNPALTGIADDLEQLKGELQKGTVDGQAIGRLLTEVGEKTTSAAAAAQPGAGEKVSRLGTLLTQAGRQLSGS
jgi:hypothetical protein